MTVTDEFGLGWADFVNRLKSKRVKKMAADTRPEIDFAALKDKISAAFVLAQAEFNLATKGHKNPFFNSDYSALDDCWEACRHALAANGLAVMQDAVTGDGKISVTTKLIHSSGQWLTSSPLTMTPVPKTNKKTGEPELLVDPQSFGSCLTYARRYSLCAFLGLVSGDEDDDGNAASSRNGEASKKNDPPPENSDDLYVFCKHGYDNAKDEHDIKVVDARLMKVVNVKDFLGNKGYDEMVGFRKDAMKRTKPPPDSQVVPDKPSQTEAPPSQNGEMTGQEAYEKAFAMFNTARYPSDLILAHEFVLSNKTRILEENLVRLRLVEADMKAKVMVP